MMCTRVLAFFALQVIVANGFSWDIVVGTEGRLEFYDNGTLTHTEDIPSAYRIDSITYDPVHYRVLFADNKEQSLSISSFDLLTRKIQHLVTRESNFNSVGLAYDPVTQLLFWKQNPSIYSFSLNPAVSNKALNGNTLVTLSDYCWDIAVDSCGGHIYWATNKNIERTRFDDFGSEGEVLIESTVDDRLSLAIDQQTQRMYWIDRNFTNDRYHVYIESADFNGKNRKTLYQFVFDATASVFSSLAISKDFIYWRGTNPNVIWQLPKNSGQHKLLKSFPISDDSNWNYQLVAANYTIEEQTEGNPNCKTLRSLIPYALDANSTEENLVCVHGTKVSGESRYVCTQGYTGEKCYVSSCHNYCFQGNCVSVEGKPICRCNAGWYGERCEVNACHMYCLNNGGCFLNEENEPVCECSADYEGERCEVAATHSDDDHTDSTTQHVLRDVRKELRRAIQQELQCAMRCFSDKIDE